jgi:hypothetical protein
MNGIVFLKKGLLKKFFFLIAFVILATSVTSCSAGYNTRRYAERRQEKRYLDTGLRKFRKDPKIVVNRDCPCYEPVKIKDIERRRYPYMYKRFLFVYYKRK